jgi:hypothetical protein
LVSFEGVDRSIQHSLSQGLELVQNILVFDTEQERGGGSKSCYSDNDVLVLHALLKYLIETVFMSVKLLIAQMALSLLLKNVHGELFALVIFRLSPLYK